MRQYESVKLKNEVNALREKGIDVNTLGVLILPNRFVGAMDCYVSESEKRRRLRRRNRK